MLWKRIDRSSVVSWHSGYPTLYYRGNEVGSKIKVEICILTKTLNLADIFRLYFATTCRSSQVLLTYFDRRPKPVYYTKRLPLFITVWILFILSRGVSARAVTCRILKGSVKPKLSLTSLFITFGSE